MPLAQSLKNVLRTLAPKTYGYLHQNLSYYQLKQKLFIRRHKGIVLSGPFKGMRYIDRASGSRLMPKLLGIYEQEIYPWLEKVRVLNPSLVIDIGAAEGYYTVGLATMLPKTKVIAFEMDAEARGLCAKLAAKNAVGDRVNILGECTVSALKECIRDGALIFADCEGVELSLLNPSLLPELLKCVILVETHDCFYPGGSDVLIKRFSSSHVVSVKISEVRDEKEASVLIPVERFRKWAVDEERALSDNGRQRWLYLEPKQ